MYSKNSDDGDIPANAIIIGYIAEKFNKSTACTIMDLSNKFFVA